MKKLFLKQVFSCFGLRFFGQGTNEAEDESLDHGVGQPSQEKDDEQRDRKKGYRCIFHFYAKVVDKPF